MAKNKENKFGEILIMNSKAIHSNSESHTPLHEHTPDLNQVQIPMSIHSH